MPRSGCGLRSMQFGEAGRRRSRIGPLAVDGSTTRLPCTMSISPAATSRRAAARALSINAGQPSGSTARAASDGQIVAPAARPANSERTAASRASSVLVVRRRRQPSEQYRTASQSRAHFLRQVISRPQEVQGLEGSTSTVCRADSCSAIRRGSSPMVAPRPSRRTCWDDPCLRCHARHTPHPLAGNPTVK